MAVLGVLHCLTGCADKIPTTATASYERSGHLVLRVGSGGWLDQYSPTLEDSTISLLPGEIVPIQQFYFPPSRPVRPGQIRAYSGHNYGRVCMSCRVTDVSVARIRYAPSPNCYLPPDYEGDAQEPCGVSAIAVYLEGMQLGQTAISATMREGAATLNASAKIEVRDPTAHIAVITPHWGDKLRQGGLNTVTWRCPECARDARILLTVSNGDKSSQGWIAYLQPPNGTFVWNAKTVCGKPSRTSRPECYDLQPGYYSILAAVQVDEMDLMHAPMSSSAPFQILAPSEQLDDVTRETVKGFVLSEGQSEGDFAWVQTAANGRRLLCVSSVTPVAIPNHRLLDSAPLFFTYKDLPWGTAIEANGTWENAHSLVCNKAGSDPEAPPRMRVKELRLAGSGIFGVYEKCARIGSEESCRRVSDMPVELGASSVADARQLDGQYIAPLPPGHYSVFGTPVEVRPSHWTRFDIRLPE